MFWLKLIKKFIRILNADATPGQIAGGIALGSIIGLTPFWTIHNLVILILIVIIKVNFTSAFFSIAIFGMIGWLLDPLANRLGYYLLVKAEGLRPLWTYLYNIPVAPLTRFNNTLVLGTFLISLLLFIPLLLLTRKGVQYYRLKLKARLEKMRFLQILKASKLYSWYKKFKQLEI